MNHLGEALDVVDHERAAGALDEAGRDSRFSSRVTASRCVLTRLAISVCVGAGAMRALLPALGAKLAKRNNSAWMRLLTASVLNS